MASLVQKFSIKPSVDLHIRGIITWDVYDKTYKATWLPLHGSILFHVRALIKGTIENANNTI